MVRLEAYARGPPTRLGVDSQVVRNGGCLDGLGLPLVQAARNGLDDLRRTFACEWPPPPPYSRTSLRRRYGPSGTREGDRKPLTKRRLG